MSQITQVCSHHAGEMAESSDTQLEVGLHRVTRGEKLGVCPDVVSAAGTHHHRPPDFSSHLTRHISGVAGGDHENSEQAIYNLYLDCCPSKWVIPHVNSDGRPSISPRHSAAACVAFRP